MSQLSVKELQAILLYHPDKGTREQAEEVLTGILQAPDIPDHEKKAAGLVLQRYHATGGRFDRVYDIVAEQSLPSSVSSDLEIEHLMLTCETPDNHPAIKEQARESLRNTAILCADKLSSRQMRRRYANVVRLITGRAQPSEKPPKPKKIS